MPELESITVEGFKSIASIENLALGPINLLIGPNELREVKFHRSVRVSPRGFVRANCGITWSAQAAPTGCSILGLVSHGQCACRSSFGIRSINTLSISRQRKRMAFTQRRDRLLLGQEPLFRRDGQVTLSEPRGGRNQQSSESGHRSIRARPSGPMARLSLS